MGGTFKPRKQKEPIEDKFIRFFKRLRGIKGVTGYKAFNVETSNVFVKFEGPQLMCRDYNFTTNEEVGPSKMFTKDGYHRLPADGQDEAFCCNNGFHFCKDFKAINDYYRFEISSRQKYAEVIGRGSIDKEGHPTKYAATELKIVRVLTDEEVFDLQFPKVVLFKNANGIYIRKRRVTEFDASMAYDDLITYERDFLTAKEYYIAKLNHLFAK